MILSNTGVSEDDEGVSDNARSSISTSGDGSFEEYHTYSMQLGFSMFINMFLVHCLHPATIQYRIAGFLREDFNIALGTICNIKIRIVFVNAVICWSRDIFVSSAR